MQLPALAVHDTSRDIYYLRFIDLMIFEYGYVNIYTFFVIMFIVYWVTFSLIDIFDPHLYDVNIFELNIWFRYFSQIGNARC